MTRVILTASALLLAVAMALLAATPSPTPASDGCQAEIDKLARPATLPMGQEAEITLTVRADCSRIQQPVHVALVFDNSIHMGGRRMNDMKDAVAAFVGELDFSVSRAGLAVFFGRVDELAPLTDDPAAVIEASRQFFPREGSDLGLALRAGRVMLQHGRDLAAGDDLLEAIVLLSGSPNEGEMADLLAEAQLARDEGILVVTIAAGGNADPEILEAIASAPTFFYVEGTSSRYPALMREIAANLTAVQLTGADVVDTLPGNMTYAWGSGVPAPRVRDDALSWRYDVWPPQGITITYAVEPQELGCHPTNVAAEVELRFDRGDPERIVFPVPTVCVVPPVTATPPPATPTATAQLPTATPRPDSVYLPALWSAHCLPSAVRHDVVLVMDTSASMLEPTADGRPGRPAGRPRLALAMDGASQFVDAVALPADRVAIVTAADGGRLVVPLTGDRATLHVGLAGLARQLVEDGRMAPALDLASVVLDQARSGAEGGSGGHGEREAVVVVLTDGLDDPSDSAASARAARALGVHVFALGVAGGAGVAGVTGVVDPLVLTSMAGRPDRALAADRWAGVAGVYLHVARALECGLVGPP